MEYVQNLRDFVAEPRRPARVWCFAWGGVPMFSHLQDEAICSLKSSLSP